MTRFGKLAVTTVAATLVLIAFGGFVRAMEAGLGCPDWPTCHGALNPPSKLAWGDLKLAWIEHSHRLWAAVLIVLIVLLAAEAWVSRQPRRVRLVTLWLVPAVLSQAVLGAIVVWLKLDAASVVLHLSGAIVVLGLAIHVALQQARPAVVRPRLGSLPAATLAVTIGQMLLGSAVTGWSAGLAYGTFPSFNGNVLPPAVQNAQQVLHVAHRLTAYVVVGLVAALWWRARQSEPLVARFATVALALTAVQVTLGALNIWYRLPAWSVAPHLAVGSWIVASLYVVVFRASSRAEPEAGNGIAWAAVAA
ncbi:MAG TPA: COX15/CtaA family protein [Frankiaceae bacterium]|jgi:heme A synthase|nr:COX15/CtaA family protein [Frankiaceae bacterium]